MTMQQDLQSIDFSSRDVLDLGFGALPREPTQFSL